MYSTWMSQASIINHVVQKPTGELTGLRYTQRGYSCYRIMSEGLGLVAVAHVVIFQAAQALTASALQTSTYRTRIFVILWLQHWRRPGQLFEVAPRKFPVGWGCLGFLFCCRGGIFHDARTA